MNESERAQVPLVPAGGEDDQLCGGAAVSTGQRHAGVYGGDHAAEDQ